MVIGNVEPLGYRGSTSMQSSLVRSTLLALLSAQLLLLPSVAQKSPAATQVNRVADHADFSPRVQLKKTLPNWAVASREAGAVSPERTLGLTFTLARSPAVQTAFEQLLDDQQNPNSPRYHQWLTPVQIGDEYGPTQHDLDALTAWLESQGLTVTNVAPSRIFVEATGPAGAVAKAFGTSFRLYQTMGRTQYSAATEPSVPAALAGIIGSISGLNEIHHVAMSHASQPAANPQFSTSSGSHYVLPGDFATIFNLNPVYAANIKGAGQKVAIIGRSQVAISDITSFEQVAGIPTNTPNTLIAPTGNDPGTVSGDEGESDLDLQRVIGTAPSVTADFVISGTNPTTQEDGINIAMQYEINTLLDPVMTVSYGLCEASAGSSGVNFISGLFSQAAAEGISVFISSGDSGAAGCDQSFTTPPAVQQLSINYICSSPYATCVGGTEFNEGSTSVNYWGAANDPTTRASALGYIPEGGWNESVVGAVASSGGGVSTLVAKPAFQAGPGVPADNFRDTPDVSFPAAGHDGYIGCEADLAFSGGGTGACTVTNGVFSGGVLFSGTSAAAPSWAGVAALLNQKLGKAQGNINPLVYRLGALATGNPFHDVTLATAGLSSCDLTTPSLCNNSTPGVTTLTGGLQGYAVGAGYDLVTGWGSPDVNALLTAASGQATLPATTTTLTSPSTSTTTAKPVSFTAMVTATAGNPTGSVQFSSNGIALGAPVPLVNGMAVSTPQTFTIGVYSITAVYSGSSAFADSSSASFALTVLASGTAASTTVVTPTATMASSGTPIGVTVAVSGTSGAATGTVQLTLNGMKYGNPLAVANGMVTVAPMLLPAGSDVFAASYSGDNTYAASTGTATVTVVATPSSTSISPTTETTDPVNGYFVISSKVTAATGTTSPIPTGTISLYQGGTNGGKLGDVTLDSTGSVTVSLDATGAPAGSYTFYWVYAGDTVYAGSQSATATYTVATGFVPTVNLTPASANVSVAAGASITNSIDVASGNGFVGNVVLTCAAVFNGTSSATVVLPACSATPGTVALNANSIDAKATVNLTTTAVHTTAKAGQISRNQLPRMSSLRSFGGVAVAGLLLFCFPVVRRRRSWSALASLLLLVAVAGLAGCGGGGGSSTPTPPASTTTGTPSGPYTVTVTGGAAKTTFTLTVQ